MTVSSTTNRAGPYTGNGVTVAFAFNPPFQTKADLVVIETIIATGAQTTKALTTDYTISGTTDAQGYYQSGGTVTAVVAPAATVTWTIYRDPALTQASDWVENDADPAEVKEAAFDKLTMISQRTRELVTRALHQPDGDGTTMDALPSAVERASRYLYFNSSGQPTAQAVVSTNVTISAFMETVLDDTTASAVRSTLGLSEGMSTGSIIDAKGDLIVGTADNTPVKLAVGANGTILMARSAATPGMAYVAALSKAIYGLTYANDGSDVTNDIDINTGGAMDATGAYWMTLGTALVKRLDAAWAVGTNQGGLDTGAIGNSDYYMWLIARSDTGVVDVLFSLSSTAPTMPASYDFKRLIGWFPRSGGAIALFHTYETEGGGIELTWDAPTLDVNLANTLTTARRSDAVKVPLNFSVTAHLNVVIYDGVGTPGVTVGICCPDQTDVAPSQTANGLCNIVGYAASIRTLHQLRVRTSATGTVSARADTATVDLYAVSTIGFTWARRN